MGRSLVEMVEAAMRREILELKEWFPDIYPKLVRASRVSDVRLDLEVETARKLVPFVEERVAGGFGLQSTFCECLRKFLGEDVASVGRALEDINLGNPELQTGLTRLVKEMPDASAAVPAEIGCQLLPHRLVFRDGEAFRMHILAFNTVRARLGR